MDKQAVAESKLYSAHMLLDVAVMTHRERVNGYFDRYVCSVVVCLGEYKVAIHSS